MSALLEGFRGLGAARLAAMGGVAVAMLLMLAFLVLHGGGTDRMALLYADVDLREASQIVDLLDKAHIMHEVQGDGSRLMVPAADIPRARMLLAKDGLPTGGSIGYEIFDRGDGLTASQFQQAINQTRALEGELARSIRMIAGVKAVRVHLVLPKREPFARDRQEAQASVVLAMTGAGRMDREGVQSVLNLVAAAVPGLRPQAIGVVDSRGNVLARAGEALGTGPGGGALSADELRHQTETRLSHAVEDMLERSLGAGHVRAEAAVQMDFGQSHETRETYDPDSKVERSTQNNSSTSRSTEAPATVSVQNNLPNADAGTTPTGTQEQRTEETTNYEIGKTVRTFVQDQPQIRRISLAVMVDQVPGADGAAWQDRPAQELGRIAALARSAIGFDEKRGDTVEVVSLRFTVEAVTEPPKLTLFGYPVDKADLMRLGQTALYGLVTILALLLVLRPMVLRITAAPDPALAEDGTPLVLTAEAAAAMADPAAMLRGGADGIGLLEDESMINIGNIEGAIKASSIRRIAQMMEKHPEESMAIMRGWMQQEAA